MNKTMIGVLLLTGATYAPKCGAQSKNTLKQLKLKGEVSSYTESVYVAHDTVLHPDQIPVSKTVYTFNERGRLVSSCYYDIKGKVRYYTTYRIDSLTGLKMEERSCYPDSTFKEKTVYKYDVQGNMLEEKIFDHADSTKPAVVNRYDPKSKDEPEFDSDEEKVDIVISTKQKEPDKMGNWQIEVKYEKKLPIAITKREITYFEKKEGE
jgi:hypothetical protein